MCKNHSQKLATRESQFSHSDHATLRISNPVFENKYYFGHLTLSMSHFPADFFTSCNIGIV
jgi:hypothetical protein